MGISRAVAVIVLLSAVGVSAQCVSRAINVPDQWCDDNCLALPPFCPPEICNCNGNVAQDPFTPVTCQALSVASIPWCNMVCNQNSTLCPPELCLCEPGEPPVDSNDLNLSCFSVQEPATDAYCTDNCNKGFCPFQFCDCGDPNVPREDFSAVGCQGPFSDLTNEECTEICNQDAVSCPSCCVLESDTPVDFEVFSDSQCTDLTGAFAFTNGSIQFYIINANNFTLENVFDCNTEITNGKDFAIDSDGGLFVVDDIEGELSYIEPDCGERTVIESVRSGSFLVARPSSVEIVDGGVLVNDIGLLKTTLFRLNDNLRVVETETIELDPVTFVSEFARGNDDAIFFLDNSVSLSRANPIDDDDTDDDTDEATGLVENAAFGVASFDVLEFSDFCGLFMLSRSSRLVLGCDENGNACSKICRVDANGFCSDLSAPLSMDIDCQCNVFVQEEDGRIVAFPDQSDIGRVITNSSSSGNSSIPAGAFAIFNPS